jgi:hypothetical protein
VGKVAYAEGFGARSKKYGMAAEKSVQHVSRAAEIVLHGV